MCNNVETQFDSPHRRPVQTLPSVLGFCPVRKPKRVAVDRNKTLLLNDEKIFVKLNRQYSHFIRIPVKLFPGQRVMKVTTTSTQGKQFLNLRTVS